MLLLRCVQAFQQRQQAQQRSTDGQAFGCIVTGPRRNHRWQTNLALAPMAGERPETCTVDPGRTFGKVAKWPGESSKRPPSWESGTHPKRVEFLFVVCRTASSRPSGCLLFDERPGARREPGRALVLLLSRPVTRSAPLGARRARRVPRTVSSAAAISRIQCRHRHRRSMTPMPFR